MHVTEPRSRPAARFASCAPPSQSSQHLTVGTPDANGRLVQSLGFVRLAVLPGDPLTSANEADVTMQLSITDVRRRADLTDYDGEVQANL